MKHTKQELTQIDLSNDFGPKHGFSSITDFYGANKPGFYRLRKVVFTKAGRKVLTYDGNNHSLRRKDTPECSRPRHC